MARARLYNWRLLNQGREYPEALVMAGTPLECALYQHQHDPNGDYLCFEQGPELGLAQAEHLQRQRRAVIAEGIYA